MKRKSLDDNAFVENEGAQTRSRAPRAFRLPRAEDGSVAWADMPDSKLVEFSDAVAADPKFKQLLSSEPPPPPEAAIADATVVSACNLIFGIESLGITGYMLKRDPRVRPFILPVASANWNLCTVKRSEIEPILDPAKRLIARHVPAEWLEKQDYAIVAEYLFKLAVAKYAMCVQALEQAIANHAKKQAQPGAETNQPINGKEVVDVRGPAEDFTVGNEHGAIAAK